MNCTVPYGAVREKYSVRWFRGLTEIVPDMDGFEDVQFGEYGALKFSNVQIGDASRGYYCVVSVDRADGVVTRHGSTIELSVLGKYFFFISLYWWCTSGYVNPTNIQ